MLSSILILRHAFEIMLRRTSKVRCAALCSAVQLWRTTAVKNVDNPERHNLIQTFLSIYENLTPNPCSDALSTRSSFASIGFGHHDQERPAESEIYDANRNLFAYLREYQIMRDTGTGREQYIWETQCTVNRIELTSECKQVRESRWAFQFLT